MIHKRKGNKMKTEFIILITFLFLQSCSDYDYIEVQVGEVFENKSTLLQNTSKYKLYNVCMDYGAPVNEQCFLALQRGDKYFKFNPKYRCAISRDSIFLFQLVSFDYSEKGNWVLIERKYINGKENIFFNYDTIPSINVSTNKKGVFHFKNNNLHKIGELTNYQSLHDLPKVGFYFLSPPGLFYEKAIEIKAIK